MIISRSELIFCEKVVHPSKCHYPCKGGSKDDPIDPYPLGGGFPEKQNGHTPLNIFSVTCLWRHFFTIPTEFCKRCLGKSYSTYIYIINAQEKPLLSEAFMGIYYFFKFQPSKRIFTLNQSILTQNDNINAFCFICYMHCYKKRNFRWHPPPLKNTIRSVYSNFSALNQLIITSNFIYPS